MAKFPTYPTHYDNCKTITIAFLNKKGYLKPNRLTTGEIEWSINGNKTGSISVTSNTTTANPFLELNYKVNETPINYRVQLVTIPSNLGKGVVWFFVCPRTGKHCRILHLADTYFYHRTAFRGCMYEKQTHSHKDRTFHKAFDKVFTSDEICEQQFSKHFKTHYAGKPTKRYLRLKAKNEILIGAGEFALLFGLGK